MTIPFTDVTPEELLPFFQNSKGYIKINNGKNRRGIFVPSDAIKDPIQLLSDCVNMGISLGEYAVPKKGGTLGNLSSVNFFALDIDYDFPGRTPEEVIQQLYSDMTGDGDRFSVIPFPTFIEYGHRFRFLYALRTPYILRTAGRKRRSCIRFVQKMTHLYADCINALNPNYHAEGQKLTSTFRPAGSINKKTGWNPAEDRPYNICYTKVKLIHGGGKPMDMQEFAGFVMSDRKSYTDLREWKREHARKKARIHISGIRGGQNYLTARTRALERLQKDLSCIGMRETMCWNYYNLMLTIGKTKSEAYCLLKEFNDNFKFPLSMREVRSARTRKIYRMTEKTFYAQFGMEAVHASDPDYDRAYSRAYRKEKKSRLEKRGQLFQQKREQKKAKVKELRASGMKPSGIAHTMHLSLRTVYYYLSEEAKAEYAVSSNDILIEETDLKNCAKNESNVLGGDPELRSGENSQDHDAEHRMYSKFCAKNASVICTNPPATPTPADFLPIEGAEGACEAPLPVTAKPGSLRDPFPAEPASACEASSTAEDPHGISSYGADPASSAPSRGSSAWTPFVSPAPDMVSGIGENRLKPPSWASTWAEPRSTQVPLDHSTPSSIDLAEHPEAKIRYHSFDDWDDDELPLRDTHREDHLVYEPDGSLSYRASDYGGYCSDLVKDPTIFHGYRIPELPDDFRDLSSPDGTDHTMTDIQRALPESLYNQCLSVFGIDGMHQQWAWFLEDRSRFTKSDLREFPKGPSTFREECIRMLKIKGITVA